VCSCIGASAGGNLAAAVSLKFRDTQQTVTFRRQVLIVPCLQMFDLNTPSYQLNEQDAFLPKYWMTYFWLWYGFGRDAHARAHEFMANEHTSRKAKQSALASYVKHALIPTKHLHPSYVPSQENFGNSTLWSEVESVVTDPYFAPLMAKDLSNLPPASVAVANFDVLRDDGIMLHKRLEASGSPSKLMHYEGGFHAMVDFFVDLQLSKKVVSDLVEYLQQNL
jgi:acetyl esterase/lipase